MRKIILRILFAVLLWCEEVRSQIENDVRRGVFPFMAILFYPDETVVDVTGARFQHGAVLIKPEWLLSAAIDHSQIDGVTVGFPRKTMIARMGALTLDTNFTFNEDEDEQEREVIQIIKPSSHNKEMWWLTDITLVQTLIPFKIGTAVAPINISPKRDYEDYKNCVILVYARKVSDPAQASEEKTLTQLGVELLPPSVDNCGSQFNETTMACAVPSDESKIASYATDYCQGNSGGPLVCEGEVVALQTYIENNCKPPHLYQLLASWDSMITCGVDQKCGAEAPCNVCLAIHKDISTDEAAATTSLQVDTTEQQNETERYKETQNETDATDQLTTETGAATSTGTGTSTVSGNGSETAAAEETDSTKTSSYPTTIDIDSSPEITESKETTTTSESKESTTTSESKQTTTSSESKETLVTFEDIPHETTTRISESTNITTVASNDSKHEVEESGRRIMSKYDIFKEYSSGRRGEDSGSTSTSTSPADTTVTTPTPYATVSRDLPWPKEEESESPIFRAKTTPVTETTSNSKPRQLTAHLPLHFHQKRPRHLKGAGCRVHVTMDVLPLLILTCIIEVIFMW